MCYHTARLISWRAWQEVHYTYQTTPSLQKTKILQSIMATTTDFMEDEIEERPSQVSLETCLLDTLSKQFQNSEMPSPYEFFLNLSTEPFNNAISTIASPYLPTLDISGRQIVTSFLPTSQAIPSPQQHNTRIVDISNPTGNHQQDAHKLARKRAPKASTMSAKKWEPCENRLRQLYVNERKSIEEVREIVNKEFRLSAT